MTFVRLAARHSSSFCFRGVFRFFLLFVSSSNIFLLLIIWKTWLLDWTHLKLKNFGQLLFFQWKIHLPNSAASEWCAGPWTSRNSGASILFLQNLFSTVPLNGIGRVQRSNIWNPNSTESRLCLFLSAVWIINDNIEHFRGGFIFFWRRGSAK